jgi:phosphoserine phosphatase RsbU/P
MARPPRSWCRFGIALLVSVVPLLAGPALPAQAPPPVFDATQLREPRFLDMTWLVHDGDDPAYASPDFDDSRWQRFDPNSPIEAVYGKSRPEVVWYRLHLKVDPAQKGLALDEIHISRAFEIYVSGERIMQSGIIRPYRPYTMDAHILAPIPEGAIATGSAIIALRVHLSPSEWINGQNPGYYGNNLRLGQYRTLNRESWLTVIGENLFKWIDHVLLITLGFVALVLFVSQRRQTEYLWLFAAGAVTLIELPESLLTTFRNIPVGWEVANALPRLVSPYIFAALYFSFVRRPLNKGWRSFLIFAGAGYALAGMGPYLFASPVSTEVGEFPFMVFISVIIPGLLAIHWRRGNREAAILLIPVVLLSLYIDLQFVFGAMFQFPAWRAAALRGFTIIHRHPLGPFIVPFDHVCGILATISLAIIMLTRSTRISRRQARMETELEAAQQVQQVLVPEHSGTVPGFAVDSVYLPAAEVGGDFFQIIPAADGSLLVIVGDVAGKGLPAAMMVSVLVGAIRGVADFTRDPAELLRRLNERLVGRAGGGFATALSAAIAADGTMHIANAGHLPPYLNGEEIPLPGALPLGLVPGGTYESTHVNLPPGARLTFFSDGVVEAQNVSGELFGFDRSRALSQGPARSIAEAARKFGQQDDITVVTIDRTAVLAVT